MRDLKRERVHRNNNRRLRHRLCIGCRNTSEHYDISTWEILGRPAMVPSLGGIGLFKGKMITLCGRVINIPMISHRMSTKRILKLLGFLRITPHFHFY